MMNIVKFGISKHQRALNVLDVKMDGVLILVEYAKNVKMIVWNVILILQINIAYYANKIQLGIGYCKNVHSLKYQTVRNRSILNAKSVKTVSILTLTAVIVVTSKAALDAILWMIIRSVHIASLGTHLWSNMMRIEYTMLVKRMEFKETLMLLSRRSLVVD